MGYYYETEFKFRGSPNEAFEKSKAILDFLGWNYRSNEVDLIVATVPISAFGWGEKLTISVQKHHMLVSSESRNPFQVFDNGKNESNVDKFRSIFRRARLPFNREDFSDEKPRNFIERFLSGR